MIGDTGEASGFVTEGDMAQQPFTSDAAFRRAVRKVVAALVVFLLGFTTMYLIAVALACAMVLGGIFLVTSLTHLVVVGIGVVLMLGGISLLGFLTYLAFARKEEDEEDRIELTRDLDPLFYAFVEQVASQTGTAMPHSIQLSLDVNAGVYFENTWLSLLFPRRKNLVLGLGLVELLTAGELKGVLAHEFGHFSQKSLRLGNFVFRANAILFRLLHDGAGSHPFLEKMLDSHYVIALGASVCVKVVQVMQFVAYRLYGFVNAPYMALSKQMEFHADGIAAAVAGSEQVAKGLSRMGFGTNVYHYTLVSLHRLMPERKKVQNFFPLMRIHLRELAKESQLPLENGWPVLNAEANAKYTNRRVDIFKQWESHPTLEERTLHMNALGIVAPIDSRPAWEIFSNAEQHQQRLTQRIYAQEIAERGFALLSHDEVAAETKRQRTAVSHPAIFRDYFEGRLSGAFMEAPASPDLESVSVYAASPGKLFEMPFSLWPHQLEGLKADIQDCSLVVNGVVKLRHFEVDGTRIRNAQAPGILSQLAKEWTDLEAKICQHDQLVLSVATHLAVMQGRLAQLSSLLEAFRATQNQTIAQRASLQAMREVWKPLMEYVNPTLEDFNHTLRAFAYHQEKLVGLCEDYLRKPIAEWGAGADSSIAVNAFLQSDKRYIIDQQLYDRMLDKLFTCISAVEHLADLSVHHQQRKVLLEIETIFNATKS